MGSRCNDPIGDAKAGAKVVGAVVADQADTIAQVGETCRQRQAVVLAEHGDRRCHRWALFNGDGGQLHWRLRQ